MRLFLFIEDETQSETYKQLVSKMTNRPCSIRRFRGYSHLLNDSEVTKHVKLCALNDETKVVAVIDNDCDHERERRAKVVENRVQQSCPGTDVRYVVALQALESWLGCDSSAISTVLGNADVRTAIASGDCRPKDTLKKLFASSGKEYSEVEMNLKLAKALNINTAIRQNPSFNAFREAIVA